VHVRFLKLNLAFVKNLFFIIRVDSAFPHQSFDLIKVIV